MRLKPVIYHKLEGFIEARPQIAQKVLSLNNLATDHEKWEFVDALEQDQEPVTLYSVRFKTKDETSVLTIATDLELGLIYMSWKLGDPP